MLVMSWQPSVQEMPREAFRILLKADAFGARLSKVAERPLEASLDVKPKL